MAISGGQCPYITRTHASAQAILDEIHFTERQVNAVKVLRVWFNVMKILVVHRQKLVRDQIRSAITDDNSTVVINIESGLDGLLTSRIETFDLIICGTDLPVITGFELVRSIKTNSANRKVPVIMIADNVDEKAERLSTMLGVSCIMNLREVPERLGATVRKTMDSVRKLNIVFSGVTNYN